MKRIVNLCIAFFFSVCITNTSNAGEDSRAIYTLGVVPQSNVAKLADNWLPLVGYLNKKTQINIRFSTAKNITEFEKSAANGVYDFIYVNPNQYVVHHRSPGYFAIARDSKKLHGIIVVHKESEIQSMEQLAGKKVGFPAPTAFGATLLPLNYFERKNIEIIPEYMDSHDSVYLNVARRIIAAGGGVVKTLNKMPPSITADLKILWQSPQYMPHAIAAHPRVPSDVVKAVKNALVNARNDPAGGILLDNIGFDTLLSATDNDWNDVRALDLTPPK